MGFTLIRGSFHVRLYSPDGDSIRFGADDPDLFGELGGVRPVKLNQQKHAQLRIEGIDSPETHYSTGGGTYHQPLDLAFSAAEGLLAYTGIKNIQWDAAHRTIVSADDGTRGYILSRAVEKNGRPVAFVFAGDPAEADGDDVFLESNRVRESYNYRALLDGHAYATFYKGLFRDLRDALAEAVQEARKNGRGIYASDATNGRIDGSSLRAITDEVTIMPKLFRRLTDYIVSTGSAAGFKDQLDELQEPVFDLRESNFTHFDTFVEQEPGSTEVTLTRRPEELVFDEMITKPTNAFAVLTGLEDDPLDLVA